MDCQNCHENIESGARFCGNCGQRVPAAARLGATSLRNYSLALTMQHAGETQALISLLCGILGLAGTVFIPVLGLVLGLAGLVLGTVSRAYINQVMRLAGLVLSSLAVLASLVAWAHAVRSDPRVNPAVSRAAPASNQAVAAADIKTPCYRLSFVNELNVSQNGCDFTAYNGKTAANSTNAYKIYALKSDIASLDEFSKTASAAIQKDFGQNLKQYTVKSQRPTTFAGSPAYVFVGSDARGAASVTEAVVLHESAQDKNVFVIIHANTGDSADLQLLESQWQWR